MKRKEIKKGFTLIEVIVALSLAAVILSGSVYNVLAAISLRNDAQDLYNAMFLAEQVLNQISVKDKPESGNGEFENYPGYTYEYLVEEEDVDIFSLFSQVEEAEEKKKEEGDLGGFEALIAESGSDLSILSGVTIAALSYKVIVYFGDRSYELKTQKGNDLTIPSFK